MRMKSLPKFGIKIVICYEDRKWGEDVFLDLLELHKSCRLLRYSQSSERAEFIDGTIIQLVKPVPHGFCGQRADVVLAQGTIDKSILEKVVRPLAKCWVWHNDRWLCYEDWLFEYKEEEK